MNMKYFKKVKFKYRNCFKYNYNIIDVEVRSSPRNVFAMQDYFCLLKIEFFAIVFSF